MKINTYCCDICTLQKGGTNHWHRAVVNDEGITVTPWGNTPIGPTEIHLCSDACVIKVVQQWLSAQKELSQKGE